MGKGKASSPRFSGKALTRRCCQTNFPLRSKFAAERGVKSIEYRMSKWKISFFVTLTLLIGSNLYWLYSSIDMGMTYTYQQMSLEDLGEAHSFLGDLMVEGGKDYSQKDILHLIRQSRPNAFIVEEDHKIIVNKVTFTFEDGKLSKVY